MTVLEQITRWKNQGRSDEDIKRQLEEQGVSPKAIGDAFHQSKIKNAVSNSQDMEEEQRQFNRQLSLAPPSDDPELEPPPTPTLKQTQEVSEGNFYAPQAQQPQQIQPPQQEYYPQAQQQEEQQYYQAQPYEGGYENQEGYGQSYQPLNFDTDTVMEISEQVFAEKVGDIKKQVDEINEFKILAKTRLENLMDRIKRMEDIIDKLQIAILDKIGSYGQNLESIKKEMNMMQDSFGKLINPLVDHAEGKHAATHTTHKSATHHKSKSKK